MGIQRWDVAKVSSITEELNVSDISTYRWR